jgi:hypothetical protein
MSDDGYAGDSPFADIDEYLFWNDDVSVNLADDLAEHTLPSPVYFQDPAYEMMASYSDWEYYSDDYYDDDPGLLRGNPQSGSPPAMLKRANGSKARGKKRKHYDVDEIPELSLGEPELVRIMRGAGQYVKGTIWRDKDGEVGDPHYDGMSKRVALLKDWREVFKDSQPKSDKRSKISRQNSESLEEAWANELGLEEMGLRRTISKRDGVENGEGEHDEDEKYEDADAAEDGYNQGNKEEDPMDELVGHGPELDHRMSPSRKRRRSEHEETEMGRIKRRLSILNRDLESPTALRPEALTTYPSANHPNGISDTNQSPQPRKAVPSRLHSASSVTTFLPDDSASAPQVESCLPPAPAPNAKKRKADADADADADAAEPEPLGTNRAMSPSRAKRIASGKRGVRAEATDEMKDAMKEGKLPPVPKRAASSRPARTRK